MFKILSKKVFGAKGENILVSLISSIILYSGLSLLEYKIDVAHRVMMLINMFFSGAIMIRFLSSDDNARYLKGFFAMPFSKKSFILEYTTVVGVYVMFTKTLLIYALIFAFSNVSILRISLIIAEYIFICFGSMLTFAFFRNVPLISFSIPTVGILTCFLLPESYFSVAVYIILSIIMAVSLLIIDPYKYMINVSKKNSTISMGKSNRFLIGTYILRYILSNKSYIVSPVIILIFICFMVNSMNNMGFHEGIFIGMALTTANTPLAIVVSSSRTLDKKLYSMPNRVKSFFLPYTEILFLFYMVCNLILIIIMKIIGMEIYGEYFAVAVIFSVQGALATAFMENKYTIKKWNVETDLWHNPRKYIVPAILAVESAFISLI